VSTSPFAVETLQQWCRRNDQPYAEYIGARPIQTTANALPIEGAGKPLTYAFRSPPMFVGRVIGGRVIPSAGLVCTDDGRLIYEGLSGSNENPAQAMAPFCKGADAAGQFLMALPDSSSSVGDECIFVGGIANFGHFIFESLLRLMALHWRPELTKLPVAVYDDLPKRFREFLVAVGISAERHILIRRDVPTHFDRVWLLSSPMHRRKKGEAALCLDAAWWLRFVTAPLARSLRAPRPRWFIARGGAASWRRIVNEKAVLEIADAYDVKPIDLGTLSAAEQIAMVSNAELLICPAGAASQISAFAPPDCIIIELTPPKFAVVFGPIAFALALNQPYARLTGRVATADEVETAGLPPAVSDKPIDRDYVIDADELEKALTAATVTIVSNRLN